MLFDIWFLTNCNLCYLRIGTMLLEKISEDIPASSIFES
jgi:hypothetical protein